MVTRTREARVDDATEGEDAAFEMPQIKRYTISSYGADYPIDSLYKRMTSSPDLSTSDIYVPDWQRGYIWTKPQADRFIESILLGLPVPGIFLSRDERTQKLFIIDGSQRLRTIRFFIDGVLLGKEFKLDRVHSDFREKTYQTLIPEDRRRFDDFIIHATVVKQEEPDDDGTSIYYLFDRINTGGTPAQPQEIRRSIFAGSFNELISKLDENPAWRRAFGPQSKRLKDQELILRFLALHNSWRSYNGTMKDFLTSFMAKNRDISARRASVMGGVFTQTIEVIDASMRRPFRPVSALNAAVYDAVMVGLAARLERGPVQDVPTLVRAYRELLANTDFISATRTGTSQEANVKRRIELAIAAFGEVA